MLVKKAELAIILGVHPKTLDNYIQKEGMPGRRGASRATQYDLQEVIPWYVNHQVQLALKSYKPNENGTFDLEQAKAEYETYKAERQRILLLKDRRDIITIDKADDMLNSRLTQVRSALEQIPNKWCSHIVGLETLEQATRTLELNVQRMLEHLTSLPFDDDEEETEEADVEDVVELDEAEELEEESEADE